MLYWYVYLCVCARMGLENGIDDCEEMKKGRNGENHGWMGRLRKWEGRTGRSLQRCFTGNDDEGGILGLVCVGGLYSVSIWSVRTYICIFSLQLIN